MSASSVYSAARTLKAKIKWPALGTRAGKEIIREQKQFYT